MLDDDAIEVAEADLDGALAVPGPVDEGDDLPFRIDDDLFLGSGPGDTEVPGTATSSAERAGRGGLWPAAGAELPGPAFVLAGEEPGGEAAGEPIIDRYDEVPERYWAPEVASLGRRALALLVDQSFLLAALGVCYLGAFVALRHNGLDTRLFSSRDIDHDQHEVQAHTGKHPCPQVLVNQDRQHSRR
jgi:hypothetical protein